MAINNIHVPAKFMNINVNDEYIYEHYERCNNGTHDYCKYIKNLINRNIENKYKNININLLRRYFLTLNDMLCFTVEYPDHLTICKYLLENIFILNCYTQEVKINIFQNIKNVEVSDIFMKYFISKNIITIDNIFYINKNEVLFIKLIEVFLKENTNNTTSKILEILNYAIRYSYINTVNFLINMNIQLDNIIFDKIIFLIIKAYTPNPDFDCIDLIKKCIMRGAIINNNTLNNLLLNIKNFGDYLNSYHTVSTNDTFTRVLKFLYYNGSTDFFFINFERPRVKFDIQNFINYIVDNGYILSENDFRLLCEWGIMIKNISKVKHFFELTEIKNIIIQKNIKYPIIITYDIENLKSACRYGQIKDVIMILKTVKPTQECIELASLCESMPVIRLLRETYNLKFNDVCLLNIAQYSYKLKHTQCLKYITELYKKNLNQNNINQNNLNQNNLNQNNLNQNNNKVILGLTDDSYDSENSD